LSHSSEDRTLAYQLISFVFIAMLLVFLASILVTRSIYKKIILDTQLDNMRHLAHERVYLLDGIMANVEALGRSSLNLMNESQISSNAFEAHLKNVLLDNQAVHSICYVQDPEAGGQPQIFYTVRHSFMMRRISGRDFLYNDWYQIPSISGRAGWIEPWFDAEGKGVLMVSYAMPMYQNGDITGVLRFDIELSYLQELLINNASFKVGNSFLISSTGTLISYKDPTLVMHQTLFSLAQEYDDPTLARLGFAMVNGEMGHLFINGSSPMAQSWIYYHPLKSNRWSVAIAIPERDLMASVNVILWIQTMASILIFLVVAVIIYARALNVSKPLRTLAVIADKIGAGDFDARLPVSDKSIEISRLTESFATMQRSLKNYIANLKATTEEKDKIHGDVIYASEIQTNLIPKNCPHPLGIKELRAFGILEPAGDIGGDLYDYFMMDEDHFCFVIADVLGKGIVAAMAMTMVSSLLPSIAPYHKSSSELLKKLNIFLCRNNVEANFITIILGVLNIKTGMLEYSNCGHVPMVIRKIDRSFTRYFETHATALGVFENLKIGSDTIQLNRGDELILFTDGITEAMNAKEELLGITGLEEIITNLSNPNPEETAKGILAAVHKFAEGSTHKDDITILVMDYQHPGLIR
jgi:phosphoserine phosphatase RsbU/P